MECVEPEVLTGAAGIRRRPTLAELTAALSAGGSVTAVLQRWCEHYGIGNGPIEAEILASISSRSAPSEVCLKLGLARYAVIGYRHVVLTRASVRLCEAINWYDPRRLTAAMNEALASTCVPFGRVVAELGVHRSNAIVSLPDLAAPTTDHILEIRADVTDAAGVPFAVVREWFAPALLGK
jgi:chorismate-pyruvate lyase